MDVSTRIAFDSARAKALKSYQGLLVIRENLNYDGNAELVERFNELEDDLRKAYSDILAIAQKYPGDASIREAITIIKRYFSELKIDLPALSSYGLHLSL